MNPSLPNHTRPSSPGKSRTLGSTRILRVVFGILPNTQENQVNQSQGTSTISLRGFATHLPSPISAAQRPSSHLRRKNGYLLLELILAMTLFGLAVLGLARTLQMTIQTGAIIRRDHEVRIALRCFLEEVRRKPLAELSQSYLDPRFNLTLQSIAEPLELRDYNGTVLNNLYKLRVFTTYEAGAEMREEALEVFVYKTETETQQ